MFKKTLTSPPRCFIISRKADLFCFQPNLRYARLFINCVKKIINCKGMFASYWDYLLCVMNTILIMIRIGCQLITVGKVTQTYGKLKWIQNTSVDKGIRSPSWQKASFPCNFLTFGLKCVYSRERQIFCSRYHLALTLFQLAHTLFLGCKFNNERSDMQPADLWVHKATIKRNKQKATISLLVVALTAKCKA